MRALVHRKRKHKRNHLKQNESDIQTHAWIVWDLTRRAETDMPAGLPMFGIALQQVGKRLLMLWASLPAFCFRVRNHPFRRRRTDLIPRVQLHRLHHGEHSFFAFLTSLSQCKIEAKNAFP